MDEERFENYYKLPKIILEIMSWLCQTRFYNKTFKERKELYEDVKENWKFCDFVILNGTLEKPLVIKIGEIPNYQGEYEKTICIDLTNIENCYLIRGYAVGYYARKVLQNTYTIPKYMKGKLTEFIENINWR